MVRGRSVSPGRTGKERPPGALPSRCAGVGGGGGAEGTPPAPRHPGPVRTSAPARSRAQGGRRRSGSAPGRRCPGYGGGGGGMLAPAAELCPPTPPVGPSSPSRALTHGSRRPRRRARCLRSAASTGAAVPPPGGRGWQSRAARPGPARLRRGQALCCAAGSRGSLR